MKKVVVTVVAVLVLEALAVVLLAKMGAVGVAATQQNPAVVDWLLTTDRKAAIADQVGDIKVPALDDAAMVRRGFDHYAHMCVGCHGAPGVRPGDAARGLNPKPPDLSTMGSLSTRREAHIFWIVKHGIRMTGMPAFGPTHDDAKIWDIVAFVSRLQELSPGQYQAMLQSVSEADAQGDRLNSGAGSP